jgi:hypothetical protein
MVVTADKSKLKNERNEDPFKVPLERKYLRRGSVDNVEMSLEDDDDEDFEYQEVEIDFDEEDPEDEDLNTTLKSLQRSSVPENGLFSNTLSDISFFLS